MANRFIENDKSKWTGPLYMGKPPTLGGDASNRITKWHFTGPAESKIPQLKGLYEAAVGVTETLRKRRGEVEATKQFTPLGVTEQLAQAAVTGEIPALRRARAAVEKVKAEIAEKRGSLKISKPTDEQQRELSEIRSAMRSMTPAQRDEFVKQNRKDPTVALAIASAIPALSGVHPLLRQNIADEMLELEHGEALGELRDLEEVVNVVDRVTDLARNELREIVGCSREIFETIARVGEHAGGELPLKVETKIIDGKAVDVCRVYDMAAKEWRDATAEEIRQEAA